jgi:peroxiredoxin
MSRLERLCIALMLVLCIVIVTGTALLLRRYEEQANESESQTGEDATDYSSTLTEYLSYFPENLLLGETLPVEEFQDEQGHTVSLQQYRDNYMILTYWASWCKYCKQQLNALSTVENLLRRYGDVRYCLVDKLDGSKETKDSAQSYLTEQGITLTGWYDESLIGYNAMGMKIVPTTLFLNRKGQLALCHAGVIESEDELAAMIDYVRDGADAATLSFISEQMLSEEGGMCTETASNASARAVLSESQSLLMEYAAATGNKTLFTKAYSFVKKYMQEYPLAVWQYGNTQAANANALLDDLRMLKALNAMDGYSKDAANLAQTIAVYNTNGNFPVDFYDFDTEQKASTFTLCYADFVALEQVENASPTVTGLTQNALTLVEGGYIGDEFPMYRNTYSYTDETYSDTSLNMAEALYTLYHLAEIGQLKASSLNWLKEQMNGGCIWARYDIEGNVVPGSDYESPAIYALVGLIALEVGDRQLYTQAVSRMENWRTFDTASPLNGSFGDEDTDIRASYDQCMPLLLYAKSENQEVGYAL